MGTVLGMAASTTMGMASNPQSSMILWVLQGTVAASIGIGLVMAASITMGMASSSRSSTTLSTLRISDHSFSDNGNRFEAPVTFVSTGK
eukprot:XP_027305631.1 uncharacterized protein LOC113842437 isoform X3 [Anas platyrhynchos]